MSDLPLGQVFVEVKADLDKLVSDFSRGRRATQQFANDVNRVTNANTAFGRSNLQLQNQISGLVRQYEPLKVAQQQYASNIQVVNSAQKAGMISAAEGATLQKAMARTFQDTEKSIEGETVGLEGWARATEHHIRAFRLLLSFIGIDLGLRLAKGIVGTLEQTAAIKQQADELGLSTEKWQEYLAVAPKVSMTADDMKSAFQTLGKNIDDVRLGRLGPFNKLMVDLFGKTGAAAEKLKPLNQIFDDINVKMTQVGDKAQRTGANEIAFGEAGRKMGELQAAGASGLAEMVAEAHQMGLILDQGKLDQAEETSKKLNVLWQVLKVQFADTVVQNAKAIESLATSLEHFASVSLGRIIQTLGELAQRIEQVVKAAGDLGQAAGDMVAPEHTPERSILGQIMRTGYDFKTGKFGQYDDKGNFSPLVAPANQPSVTVPLPPLKPVAKPKGPNIDLSNVLAPKGAHQKQPKFDEFQSDLDREKERQLQLEEQATADVAQQNAIAKQIIDLQLKERIQQIQKQVHSKELTRKEGQQLTAEAEKTALMEKENADQKERIALIQQQYQFAAEKAKLESDGLNIAKRLATNDNERDQIDRHLLSIQQEQEKAALDEQIEIARENHWQERVNQLLEERADLLKNQNAEYAALRIEQLKLFDKFKYDLPYNQGSFDDATKKVRFDLFNQKLQEAAQFASDIGDAFGQAAGALANFENPLKVATDLLHNLAATFTKEFIEKPVKDFIESRVGIPLAKQGFKGQLSKLAGKDALTDGQFNTALALATGDLHSLQAAEVEASKGLGFITTNADPASAALEHLATAGISAATALERVAAGGTGGVAGGGAGDLGSLASLFGGGGGGGDLTSLFTDPTSMDSTFAFLGYADGGFTGSGANDDVKGVVHANEFVIKADAVRSIGLPILHAMNARKPGFAAGGFAGTALRVGRPDPFATGGGGLVSYAPPSTPAASSGDMGDAAQMLMQAASQLMDAAKALSGGGKGGGLLGGLLGLAGGLVGGSLLGGKGGGGLGGLLGGLFKGGGGGGGGGSLGGLDLSGSMGSTLGFLGGYADGGFTGSGSDQEVAGVVHKNEWVWDAPTTRTFVPVLQMISSGRLPGFTGPGLAGQFGLNPNAQRGPQPLHFHFGDMHIHGATDDRSARRSGRQALGVVQRGMAELVRKNLVQHS